PYFRESCPNWKSLPDYGTLWIYNIAGSARLREPIGNVCLVVKIRRMRVLVFALRLSRLQFRRPPFVAPVFKNRDGNRSRNPAQKIRYRASPTSALSFVDLFLAEQIGDRESLRRLFKSGHKFLEAFREKIVAKVPIKHEAWRSEIMFVEIPPAAPIRFIHQSIDVV